MIQPDFVRTSAAATAVLVMACLPQESTSQVASIDTSRVYELETIVKTATRDATVLASTTSATSVINADAIRRSAAFTVADLIARTPGINFFSLDGLGYDPQPTVRGFYGGGEAEYVQLQLDGQPLADTESGLVNWFVVPETELQSIEILRGGSSALYGDAAVGAVINLVSVPLSMQRDALSIRSGAYVPFESSFRYSAEVAGRSLGLFGEYMNIDGYRDHASRDIGSVGARFLAVENESLSLTLNTDHYWNYGDVPGPILMTGSENPESSLSFFRYDRTEESIHRAGGSGSYRIGDYRTLEFSVSARLRNVDAVETVPLSAGFADTQQREIRDFGARANAQVNLGDAAGTGRVIAGLEASSSGLDSRYFSLLSGTEQDYSAAPANPDLTAVSDGDGTRVQAAGYAHYELLLLDRLRLTAGGRLDVLRDKFNPDGADGESVTHTALSPKAGVNYRLVSSRSIVTNVYANVSRSFKAPTFDQLYDQRAIPVPFPPFQVQLSSPDLDPQYGVSYEVGAYHRFESKDLSGEVSLSVYQIDMRDEIDFDLETLSYRNLGKSRHRGVESGAKLYAGPVTIQGSYAYQSTTLRFGDYDGNYVKAIPRDIISAGVDVPVGPVEASATLKSARRIFLDDANTMRLPSYTTVDLRLGYDFGRAAISGEVFNVLDASFSTTGFPDPGGSEAVFIYPFAGRHLRLGANVRLP